MIKLENVSVTFKKKKQVVQAVKNVDIHIKKGEIYGIVGGSGAGKSTLIRTINGLQKPTSGDIYVDGIKINDLSRKELRNERKEIAMIFQHFNLISRKTVGQNIEFALKIHKQTKEDRKKRVKELLKIVGLEDKENIYPQELSGGQKQRVGIARALATNPKILLCDEATSALDVKTTKEIVEILKDINEKFKITIVFITHQLEVAKQLFDRIAVINNGTIVEENAVYDIFAEPKAKFTKELIFKEINLPKEVVEKADGQIVTLLYKGKTSLEPVIANVNKNFGVRINILQGNIEYIKNNPIGSLVVSISGDVEEIKKAYNYLKQNIKEVNYYDYKEEEAV